MAVTIHNPAPSGFPDEEVERWRKIPVSIAVDLQRNGCEIDPDIRPLRAAGQQPRLFGRAVTCVTAPPDFGPVLYASDLVGPGDVLVIAAAGHRETAMIGEIVSGYLRSRGGVGVVVDGAVRDVDAMAQWDDFATFTRWTTPRGPAGLDHGDINIPVTVGGRRVSPGDVIMGDDDGLAALSPEFMAAHIEAAEAKLSLEAQWEAGLAKGTIAETFNLPPADKG
ncbi:MAG: RraA family protein [Hyphomicrobiales bacterium]